MTSEKTCQCALGHWEAGVGKAGQGLGSSASQALSSNSFSV